MMFSKTVVLVALAGGLTACAPAITKNFDRGIDSKGLDTLQAGIWVDPTGCDHWIIDDGVEGYLSQRLDPYGKPVCSGAAPPGYAVGPFKQGSEIPDPI